MKEAEQWGIHSTSKLPVALGTQLGTRVVEDVPSALKAQETMQQQAVFCEHKMHV